MKKIILLPFTRGHFTWTEWFASVVFWTLIPILLILLIGN